MSHTFLVFECPFQVELPTDNEDWTPYVTTQLPWTPLTPAFGLEQFGLPVPRRNAETWRHFDVVGMVQQDYSSAPGYTGKHAMGKRGPGTIIIVSNIYTQIFRNIRRAQRDGNN